jgi:hypothetical protein
VPAFERLLATRLVANPAALDSLTWPENSLVLRFAADEVLVAPPLDTAAELLALDPHAIIIAEAGYAGLWLPEAEALAFLERSCEWELPQQRPAFAQGAVAGIPTKLWLGPKRVLFLIPAPYAADFEERLA